MSAIDRLRVVFELSKKPALFKAIRALDPALRIAASMGEGADADEPLCYADIEMPEGSFDVWQSRVFDLPGTFAVSRAYCPIDRRAQDGTPGCTLIVVRFIPPLSRFGLKHLLNVIGPRIEICDLLQFELNAWIGTFAAWSPEADEWCQHLAGMPEVADAKPCLQLDMRS